MRFREGTFDRSKTGILRPFCPAHAVASLPEINLDDLKAENLSLILLDVDHTLVKWKQEEFSPEVLAWVKKAKEMGFEMCILSNTRHPERLARLAAVLGIETFRGRFKPSTHMYEMALEKYGKKPEDAVMIGDQIMTDVFGANRAGIDAIWVQKMEGPEFAGTKINRVVERLVTSLLYRSLVIPLDTTSDPAPNTPFFERTIVKQFLKFCFVGGISFVIDSAVSYVLMFKIPLDGDLLSNRGGQYLLDHFPSLFRFANSPTGAFLPVATVIAASIAMINSYFLNRSFTFKIKSNENKGKQALRLYIVGYMGLFINLVVRTGLFTIIPGHPKRSWAIATVLSAVIVAMWNFVGQRYFAFRVHKSE